MSHRPSFIDNKNGNTLANAISRYIAVLKKNLRNPPNLDIATAYFNPKGFLSIADEFETLPKVRILIGAEAKGEDRERWRKPGESTGEEYEVRKIEAALRSVGEDLKRDRNLLGFSREIDNDLKRLIRFLKRDGVEVRRYEKTFLHGKAYIFSLGEGVIAGSSNFTRAGLNFNLELNLGHYDPYVYNKVKVWYDELWDESKPYDLASLYEERFIPFSPYPIYLRVLWERYRDEIELEKEERTGKKIQLTTFQNDGVFRSKRFLEQYNGVLVADGVGLGKTYIAGELIREAVHDRRQRALVIAPAYLRDGMWKKFRHELNVNFETLSFNQLRNDAQLGGKGNYLTQNKDEYQLVVIDEAHSFRNPSTEQAHALRTLLLGDPPKELVLLTATPVNNSLWDLYYLLTYFIKNDAAFSSYGIPSLRERFKRTQAEDPSNLSPSSLFDILDRTTVRRTRYFVEKYYPDEVILKGSQKIRITFPEVNPIRVDYIFSRFIDDEFFSDLARGLAAGENESPELTLALYRLSQYRHHEEILGGMNGSELALIGLLRTGILKRFESSTRAFSRTIQRILDRYRTALRLLDNGVFPELSVIDEWVESDSDEAFEEIFKESEPTSAEVLNRYRLESDLKSDIRLLEKWKRKADSVDMLDDSKLKRLREILLLIKEAAEKDTSNEEDLIRNRKVIIFSYFEDTVDWILDYLEKIVKEEEFSCYRDRIAGVAGKESKRGVTRNRAVIGFAPNSTDAPPGTKDEFDILVTTDVLAQGVNLQQCRNVINYDLPWNPMRVVQRNGRIDRINSPHRQIFTYSFFPENRLDQLLQLERRIMRKLAQTARSIGLETEVFPDAETVDQNFADRIEQIEALRQEDKNLLKYGGTVTTTFTGEEYRQELRKGLKDFEEKVEALPWGAGSGFSGEYPGYLYCARIGDENFLRFIPTTGEVEIVRDTLTCLQRIECSPDTERYLPDRTRNSVYEAWTKARKDIYEQWQTQTDPKNIEPEIRPLFRRVAKHLRDFPPKDVNQRELEKILESVEAPWGRRYEMQLREIFRKDISPEIKSKELLEKIKELGLQPFIAPEPLPPIKENEIKLVCWLAITQD